MECAQRPGRADKRLNQRSGLRKNVRRLQPAHDHEQRREEDEQRTVDLSEDRAGRAA